MSRRPSDRPRVRRWGAVLAAVVLGVTAQPAFAFAAAPSAAVDKQVLTEIASNGTTTFMVYLRDQAKLSGAAALRDDDARATAVYQELTSTAERSQADLRAELDALQVDYTAYWIANALRVTGDQKLVDQIAARSEVVAIEPSRTYPLITPEPATATNGARTSAVEWGISNIQAPQVWDEFGVRGEGIVIASIDSGAQFNHPALVNSYRGNLGNGSFDHNYNWFDPAEVCSSPAPCDNNDHGTHTMGTMVGDDGAGNQIGVAPGAKWVTAKGCESNSCSDESLLASGQWVLAPTDLNGENPRPDLHADIVNNSWGGPGGDRWYEQTVNAWRAAGIFPVFSNGNSGPGCNTAGSPGDYPGSYAVGSYDVNNNISSFSSRGSSKVDNAIKPNISAPGSNVRSSVPGGGYDSFNGTSMAAPHVSGAVALVWSAAPSLRGDLDATAALLDSTATDVNATTCGGTVEKNNVFGEGRLNAYQAVNAAPRGPVGRATGLVTDAADGDPINGATVSVGDRSAVTGADGRYSLTLAAGEVELSVSKYGYAAQTATVTIPEGGAATRDFALVAAPMVTVTGRVTDGSGHGWPLYAKVDVAGYPDGPVFTDPATGRYSVTLAGGTSYRITTTAQYPGYQTKVADVAVGSSAQTVNVALPVDPACNVAGYTSGFTTPVLSQSFDATSAPEGWSVVNRTDSGGWQFNDPGARGNLTGGTGSFAIIDSDEFGSGKTQDTDLIAPALNLSGMSAPLLRFNSDFRAIGSNTVDIDVSTDDGNSWTNVWHQTTSRRGPVVEEVPLTAVAGAESVLVRFRYKGTYAWWWQVDNVQVVERTCTPTPGGLVVGFTTDTNTGAALNGVTVTSDEKPAEKAVSAATPNDPAIGDGFYWFFSSLTGLNSFTASKAPYQSTTKPATVAADGVTKVNFGLGAGRITVSTTNIEAYQPYGSARSTKFTVRNTGSAPATVEVLERAGEVTPLGRTGYPLNEVQVKGLSKASTGIAYGGGVVDGTGPLAADAWTRVADLPTAVFDNSAAALDGKIYSVGGGSGTGAEKKVWAYDPAATAWTALPDLPNARSKPAVAAVNGKLYAIGGWGGSGVQSSVDVFDPAAGSWSTLAGATNPAPTASAGTAVVDGKIYLVGGCLDTSCSDSNKVVIFDPATGTFSQGANYPNAVSWLSCGGIGSAVYCAGGAGSTEFSDAFKYDPAGDEWSPLPDLPLDLWGSQATAAGGLLVLAGGVTGGSTTITNRTVAYDPATGAWQDLPNTQFSRYRGAAACGAYKIGGSPSSFVASKEAELLGGLEQCGAAGGDLSWLTTAPTTFTLAPGASQQVTVTLSATAVDGVFQPGAYTGELGIASDSPYAVPSIGVEMNVTPPASWGKVQGTVTGTTCGGTSTGIRATVRVNFLNSPGTGYTLTADAQGKYAYWVPKGRYEVIVAKDTWVPEAQRTKIEAGFVTTLDFDLDPVSSCTRATGI